MHYSVSVLTGLFSAIPPVVRVIQHALVVFKDTSVAGLG